AVTLPTSFARPLPERRLHERLVHVVATETLGGGAMSRRTRTTTTVAAVGVTGAIAIAAVVASTGGGGGYGKAGSSQPVATSSIRTAATTVGGKPSTVLT